MKKYKVDITIILIAFLVASLIHAYTFKSVLEEKILTLDNAYRLGKWVQEHKGDE